MKQFELIYNYIDEKKVKCTQHKPIIIKTNDRDFTGKTLADIISQVKFVRKYYGFFDKTIYLLIGKTSFADKITYLLLDMIIYDLLKNTKFKISIGIDVDLTNVVNQGIKSTAMFRATDPHTHHLNGRLFIKYYEERITIRKDYYRRYITRKNLEDNLQLLSVVDSDICTFLKTVLMMISGSMRLVRLLENY